MVKFDKLLVIGLFFAVVDYCHSAVTEEQMKTAGKMMRDICQPKFKIPDDVADGLAKAILPDDKNVKCYVNCILEMMQSVKKGKFNYESTMKQIDLLLPEEHRESYKAGANACKTSADGIKNNCEASYEILKCFIKNIEKFMFP